MTLISVVIPVYGRSALLADAIESVIEQTVADFECVVVDDHSPEPVDVAHRDPRVRVVRRESNGGGGAARNTGILAAQGEWVTFLDSDDLFTRERLEIGLETVADSDVGICQLQSIGGSAPSRFAFAGDASVQIMESVIPNVGQAMVRRTLVPLFEEHLRGAEDVEWFLRLAQVARFASDPRVGVLFRHHDEQRHGSSWAVRASERELMLEMHKDFFAAHRDARSFQLMRVAELWERAGDRRRSQRAAWLSVAASPSLRSVGRAARQTAHTIRGK